MAITPWKNSVISAVATYEATEAVASVKCVASEKTVACLGKIFPGNKYFPQKNILQVKKWTMLFPFDIDRVIRQMTTH